MTRPGSSRDAGHASWYESAADLLAEPDPGETPMLVERLVADRAVGMLVGQAKLGKTYLLLDLAVSIVTGEAFLGRYAIPEPGPVLVVLEESGRKALHRRLDMLARGRAIERERLAGLHTATNRRVNLTDPGWQARLLDAGRALRPRAILLDPLARMKGSTDENAQREVAVVLDFLRELRDDADAAVLFVHHTGHEGTRARGSYDLEAYWESKLTLSRRDGDGRERILTAEHREADDSGQAGFFVHFDRATRSVRLVATLTRDDRELAADDDTLYAAVAAYLTEHPDASANDVQRHVGKSRQRVLEAVRKFKALQAAQHPHPPAEEAPTRFPFTENHPEPPAGCMVPGSGSPAGTPPVGGCPPEPVPPALVSEPGTDPDTATPAPPLGGDPGAPGEGAARPPGTHALQPRRQGGEARGAPGSHPLRSRGVDASAEEPTA